MVERCTTDTQSLPTREGRQPRWTVEIAIVVSFAMSRSYASCAGALIMRSHGLDAGCGIIVKFGAQKPAKISSYMEKALGCQQQARRLLTFRRPMSLFTFASTLRAGSGVCWRQYAAWKFAVSLRHRTSLANKVIPQEWKTPGVQLPPAEEWPKVFRFADKQKRKTLSNPETAKRLAEIFVPEGSKDKVIVEAYAGMD